MAKILKRPILILLVLLVPSAAVSAGPADAQVDDRQWVDLESNPAVCEEAPPNSAFVASAQVDCAVPIVSDRDPTLVVAKTLDTSFDLSTPCTVQLDGVPELVPDGPALLCVVGGITLAEDARDIRLVVQGSDVGSLGVHDPEPDGGIQFLDGHAVFGEMPLFFFDVRTDTSEPMHLIIRERRTGIDVTRVAAGALRRSGTEVSVELDLPDGRYRMWPCFGATPDSCVEQPGGHAFESLVPTVSPLIEGRTQDPEGRINLVFAGLDLDDARWTTDGGDLASMADQLLGLEGPERFDPAGPVDSTRPDREFAWGPFAIEPLRSNVDKFNFWVLDQSLTSRAAFDAAERGIGPSNRGLGLPNVSIVQLDHVQEPERAFARPASMSGREDVPDRDDIVFGDVFIPILRSPAPEEAVTLSHELGHALFGLGDEYVSSTPPVVGNWNCAATAAEAEEQWADFLGQSDPFAAEVLDTIEAAGIDTTSFDLVEDTRIGVTRGGCDGPADGNAYRPSENSLMNLNVPVFGALNRARVETVLDRFEASCQLLVSSPLDPAVRLGNARSVEAG